MLIDWHTHLWLPEHFAPEHGAELAQRTGAALEAGPAEHEAGVAAHAHAFVVLAMRWNRLGVDVPNRFVADYIKRFPGRARGFASVDPHDDDAPEALEHAITELGLHGLKISPVYQGFHPWDAAAWRLYACADRLRIPILWHQSAAYATESTLENGNPVLLDRVAREFPELRMNIAHLGQPWMTETVMLLRKHPQVYADLSARFHRPWQLYNGLMLALEYKVTDKLLFGSDFPVRTTAAALDEFRALNDWGSGVTLPRFPEHVIEDIALNRPFELLWPAG